MIDTSLIPQIEKALGWTLKHYQIQYLLGDPSVDIKGVGTKIVLSQVKLALSYKRTFTMIELNSGVFNKGLTNNTNYWVNSFLNIRNKLSENKLRVCKIKNN